MEAPPLMLDKDRHKQVLLGECPCPGWRPAYVSGGWFLWLPRQSPQSRAPPHFPLTSSHVLASFPLTMEGPTLALSSAWRPPTPSHTFFVGCGSHPRSWRSSIGWGILGWKERYSCSRSVVHNSPSSHLNVCHKCIKWGWVLGFQHGNW